MEARSRPSDSDPSSPRRSPPARLAGATLVGSSWLRARRTDTTHAIESLPHTHSRQRARDRQTAAASYHSASVCVCVWEGRARHCAATEAVFRLEVPRAALASLQHVQVPCVRALRVREFHQLLLLPMMGTRPEARITSRFFLLRNTALRFGLKSHATGEDLHGNHTRGNALTDARTSRPVRVS